MNGLALRFEVAVTECGKVEMKVEMEAEIGIQAEVGAEIDRTTCAAERAFEGATRPKHPTLGVRDDDRLMQVRQSFQHLLGGDSIDQTEVGAWRGGHEFPKH
ncbi:MAG: hypothetical protein JRG89_21370 [Deltaproteobacteria bacterium]|nr:hypothetical protein [Deltaproteobacteria bacterium]